MTANGDNLSAPSGINFPSNIDALVDSLEECAWPQASANNESADPISDVNQAFDNFDFGRFLQENRCVQGSTSKHVPHPACTLTRQVEDVPERMTASLTCGNKTAQNDGRFQWVPKWNADIRQTVVINPTQAGNDNWHPLGAA